jgi:succinate dehydrogenase/fumarate reductase flavoprotein subunit
MRRWKWFDSAVLALGLATLAGCGAVVAGAAAGAGAVAYVRGELKATHEAPLDDVVKATQAAIADLRFTLTSSDADAVSARFAASTADDKKIVVNLKKVTAALTEIRIRVDIFGDEELSRLILDKIKAHL